MAAFRSIRGYCVHGLSRDVGNGFSSGKALLGSCGGSEVL
jgi:hypothetical protein